MRDPGVVELVLRADCLAMLRLRGAGKGARLEFGVLREGEWWHDEFSTDSIDDKQAVRKVMERAAADPACDALLLVYEAWLTKRHGLDVGDRGEAVVVLAVSRAGWAQVVRPYASLDGVAVPAGPVGIATSLDPIAAATVDGVFGPHLVWSPRILAVA